MIAEILINTNVKTLNKTFDYKIPNNLSVELGDIVLVPFGNKKDLIDGIVVNIKEKTDIKTKEIAGIQEKNVEDSRINLAKWISEEYFCNFYDALKLLLPPGSSKKNINTRIKKKTENIIILDDNFDLESIKLTEKQQNIVNYLKNNSVSISKIENEGIGTRGVVETLIKKGILLKKEIILERDPLLNKEVIKTQNFELNSEQKQVFDSISDIGTYLIYGVTGSRKN